jgi:hypothetical protein
MRTRTTPSARTGAALRKVLNTAEGVLKGLPGERPSVKERTETIPSENTNEPTPTSI